MKKPIHPKKFLPTLTYEGGDKKLFQFITNHLKYPPEAIENKIEGTVIVKYEINYKGHITQTKVISGIGYGCDEEVVRVMKLSPPWRPAKRGGEDVRARYIAPIAFRSTED